MPIFPYDELTPIVPGRNKIPLAGIPGSGAGRPPTPVPKDIEVWPIGPQVKPPPGAGAQGKPKPGAQGKPQAGGQGQPKPGEQGKPKPGEQGKPQAGGQGQPKPGEQGKPKPGEQGKQEIGAGGPSNTKAGTSKAGTSKAGAGAGKKGPKRDTLTDTEKVIGESDATARGVIKRVYEEAKRKERRMRGKAGQEAGSSLNVFKPLIQARINWPKLLKQKVKFFADKIGKKIEKQPSFVMYPYKAQAQTGIIAKAPLRQPSRKFIYMIFAFDTSGSITKDYMQNIVTELNAVANIFEKGEKGISGKVFAMEWDTIVHQFAEFTPSKEIKVYGGGGTKPSSIFKYIDGLIKKEKNGRYLIELSPSDEQLVRKLQGTKYTTAPFLVIFTDGDFLRGLNKSSLGKVYGMSEDNIFYILTETDKYIYPKNESNHIWYDEPKF